MRGRYSATAVQTVNNRGRKLLFLLWFDKTIKVQSLNHCITVIKCFCLSEFANDIYFIGPFVTQLYTQLTWPLLTCYLSSVLKRDCHRLDLRKSYTLHVFVLTPVATCTHNLAVIVCQVAEKCTHFNCFHCYIYQSLYFLPDILSKRK